MMRAFHENSDGDEGIEFSEENSMWDVAPFTESFL
jgi:hypothetical protein